MQIEFESPKDVRVDDDGKFVQRTISGLKWTLAAQVMSQGARFLISVLLARLLAPVDFGLLAMTAVFTGFADLFSDFGFSSALIQRKEIEDRHYSSVFWLNLGLGILLAGLAVAAAPLVSRFYHEPRLASIMMVISISFPLASLSLVQRAALTRAMEFRSLGLIDTGTAIVSGGIAIVLAMRGFGVWSLVWQLLLSSVLTVLATWWVTGWRPQWSFDRAALADLFGFSANLTGFSLINYWFRNGDNMVVGKYFGSAALGIYARAYNLMLLPLTQITYVVSKVMFPALSRMQDDKARVRSVYLRSIALIALITFPLMLGLLVVADHFVLAIYGNAWAGVIPILRMFCVLGLVQSISSTAGSIYQSQGRTDWMFWWGTIYALLYIGGIILGVWLGSSMAVAACLTVVGILLTPVGFIVSGKLIGMSFLHVAKSAWGVLACATAMACSIWFLGALLPPSWSHWAYLSVVVPFGVGVYAVLIHLFQLAPYRELRTLLTRQVRATIVPPVLRADFREV